MRRAKAWIIAGQLAWLIPSSANAAGPAGDWVGMYTCPQGVTDLDMRIVTTPDGLRAMFHFTADPSNPKVPDGCFSMNGRLAPDGLGIILLPDAWRLRPFGYIPVGMSGKLNKVGNVMFGRITLSPGCTNFILVRASTPPARPAACRDPA
jgi:hypothetical protein